MARRTREAEEGMFAAESKLEVAVAALKLKEREMKAMADERQDESGRESLALSGRDMEITRHRLLSA